MDKLCGVGSLQVVYHRFSDGVQVVRCVLEFYKAVSEVEQSYSTSINKLVRSSAYTFHSNILMQWLGSDPYEEIGTVKCSWQKLGSELSRLADHHANKAEDYITTVRKQLQSLLPRLEEMRIKLKLKIHQLKTAVEAAEKNNTKEKQKYFQIGDTCLRMRERIVEIKSQQTSNHKLKKLENKEAQLTRDMELQEGVYKTAHSRLVQTYEDFSRDIGELYKEVEEIEKERVETLKVSLQDFNKTLSNTAPTYLEGMKRIVMSVDDIDASSDIISFVDSQRHLMDSPKPPQLEQHQATCQNSEATHPSHETTRTPNETDSMLNGNRTPSLRSQRSLSGDEADSSYESESEEDKVQGASVKQSTRDATANNVRREVSPSDPRLGHTHEAPPDVNTRRVTLDKPVLKPKPGVKSGPVVSENKETSLHLDQSTSSNSSGHTSSSSSHVSRIIERIEVTHQPSDSKPATGKEREPNLGRRSATLPKDSAVYQETASRSKPVSASPRSRPQSMRKGDRPHTQTSAREGRPRTKTAPSSSPMSGPPLAPHQRTWSAPTEVDPELMELLSKLQRLARGNDCYKILGVEPSADMNELTRARREKNKQLHPDHFARDPVRKAKAEEQLSLINQIYQDVLKNDDTRSLYDQLCHFRQFYSCIPEQVKGLEKAKSKLQSQYKSMKKAQFPLPVLEEVELAARLIQTRMNKLSSVD